MERNMLQKVAITLGLVMTSAVFAATFAERQEVREFVEEMFKEHQIDQQRTMNAFNKIESSPEIIQRITTPYEALPWDKYRTLFLSEKKITGGVKFWKEHSQTLQAAEQAFGVPAELIVAIIGVESAYGENRGKYPLSPLITLRVPNFSGMS